jgi:hypothetical protein
MRKVHIDGDVWQYKHGRINTKIWSPLGKTYIVQTNKIKGVTSQVWEEAQWSRSAPWGSILPSEVKSYIEKVLVSQHILGLEL